MYYDLINHPDSTECGLIVCSRCMCQPLTVEQFESELSYCDECYNYIHLKKWKCLVCKSSGTLRSERTVYKEHCDKEVIWYQ